jgi:predicted DNA-binding protein
MRRVNWTITERQHQELKRLSQQTGLPISELVRRAIDKYVGLVGEEFDRPVELPESVRIEEAKETV